MSATNKSSSASPVTAAITITTATATTSNKSKQLGNYELGKKIGEGVFSKVKQAVHKLTGELVAIKILEKEKIIDLQDVERVQRELHILKMIRHPSLIQLYEIIESPKHIFIVMEFCNNGEVFDYIVKHTRLSESEASKLFQEVIAGIDYLHKLQVVHRDLKPENLMLDANFNVKIGDFGLSNMYKKNELLKTACGSPCYASPEMIAGKKYESPKVDIWSAGVILFTMICGFLPFEDDDTSKLYDKILKGKYTIPSHVSADAKDFLDRLLNVDPEKRLSFEEIKVHRWFNLYKRGFTIPQGVIFGYNQMPIDHEIVEQLHIEQNIDKEQLLRSLDANNHNTITTTYYLTLKKLTEKGLKSKADINSPFFDATLIEPKKNEEQKSQYNYLNKMIREAKDVNLSDKKSHQQQQLQLKARAARKGSLKGEIENMVLPDSDKKGRSPVKHLSNQQSHHDHNRAKSSSVSYSSSFKATAAEETFTPLGYGETNTYGNGTTAFNVNGHGHGHGHGVSEESYSSINAGFGHHGKVTLPIFQQQQQHHPHTLMPLNDIESNVSYQQNNKTSGELAMKQKTYSQQRSGTYQENSNGHPGASAVSAASNGITQQQYQSLLMQHQQLQLQMFQQQQQQLYQQQVIKQQQAQFQLKATAAVASSAANQRQNFHHTGEQTTGGHLPQSMRAATHHQSEQSTRSKKIRSVSAVSRNGHTHHTRGQSLGISEYERNQGYSHIGNAQFAGNQTDQFGHLQYHHSHHPLQQQQIPFEGVNRGYANSVDGSFIQNGVQTQAVQRRRGANSVHQTTATATNSAALNNSFSNKIKQQQHQHLNSSFSQSSKPITYPSLHPPIVGGGQQSQSQSQSHQYQQQQQQQQQQGQMNVPSANVLSNLLYGNTKRR